MQSAVPYHGDVSKAPFSRFGPRGGWYAPYRVIHVPGNLDALHGPTSGKVQLPLDLDASARVTYDLGNPRRRDRMYEVVIIEGGSDEDFASWLDRDALIEAWPRLALPRPVREAWEAAHPVLAAPGARPNLSTA